MERKGGNEDRDRFPPSPFSISAHFLFFLTFSLISFTLDFFQKKHPYLGRRSPHKEIVLDHNMLQGSLTTGVALLYVDVHCPQIFSVLEDSSDGIFANIGP